VLGQAASGEEFPQVVAHPLAFGEDLAPVAQALVIGELDEVLAVRNPLSTRGMEPEGAKAPLADEAKRVGPGPAG
jgi:hypothetical protein